MSRDAGTCREYGRRRGAAHGSMESGSQLRGRVMALAVRQARGHRMPVKTREIAVITLSRAEPHVMGVKPL